MPLQTCPLCGFATKYICNVLFRACIINKQLIINHEIVLINPECISSLIFLPSHVQSRLIVMHRNIKRSLVLLKNLTFPSGLYAILCTFILHVQYNITKLVMQRFITVHHYLLKAHYTKL